MATKLEAQNVLVGRSISAVQRGVGSFLYIHLKSEDDLRLWVYLADWEFYISGDKVADSDDTEGDASFQYISAMAGRTILGLTIEDGSEAIEVSFDCDSSFQIIANDYYGTAADMMYLFRNETSILTFKSGCGWLNSL